MIQNSLLSCSHHSTLWVLKHRLLGWRSPLRWSGELGGGGECPVTLLLQVQLQPCIAAFSASSSRVATAADSELNACCHACPATLAPYVTHRDDWPSLSATCVWNRGTHTRYEMLHRTHFTFCSQRQSEMIMLVAIPCSVEVLKHWQQMQKLIQCNFRPLFRIINALHDFHSRFPWVSQHLTKLNIVKQHSQYINSLTRPWQRRPWHWAWP